MFNFQALTWTARDEEKEFVIHSYGRTSKGVSVHLKIMNYKPYHFVEIPKQFTSNPKKFINSLYFLIGKYNSKFISGMEIKNFIPFNYFTNNKTRKYVMITYKNSWTMKKVVNQLKEPVKIYTEKIRIMTYEGKLEPLLRFFHRRRIKPSGWIVVKEYELPDSPNACTDIDYVCDWDKINGIEKSEQCPLIVAGFDIECFSSDLHSFPDPEKKGDKVIQIGITSHWYNHPKYKNTEEKAYIFDRWIGVLGGVTEVKPDDCKVEVFKTEKALLKGYCNKISRLDPDVIVGHNIFGFDNKFLWKRAELLGITTDFSRLHRLNACKASYREINMKSSAYGDNSYGIIMMEGRAQIDTYRAIQREHKLESYSLKTVSKHFLGNLDKIDLPPKQIFEKQLGSDEDRAEIATYCIRDCVLCNHLVHKLDILTSNIGMSNVACVPFTYLFVRGQSIKTQSQVALECLKEGMVMKDIFRGDRPKIPYEGAKVIDPEVGLHTEEVTVLDFNSLYPSIMISENISPDTLVVNEIDLCLPDYNYNIFKYQNPETKEKYKAVFAAKKDGTLGILPRTVDKLLKARKDTRKKIKTEKDPFKRKMLNSLQLAYKVSANSIYGGLGSDISAIYSPESAASITAKGREHLISAAKRSVELVPGTTIVYGDTDSVFLKFPFDDSLDRTTRIKNCIDKGIWLGKEISKDLKPPMNLAYEKVLMPFILFSRKRYVGNLYEEDPEQFIRKSMGIVTKRRDNAPLARILYSGILDILLDGPGAEGDKESAISEAHSFFKDTMNRLLSNDISRDDLTITKTLNAGYKFPDRIAHNVLAKRMKKRHDPHTPQVNDRIPYMFIVKGSVKQHKHIIQGNRIEHPEYIAENDIDIDYYAYIDHVKRPILSLMKCITEEAGNWFTPFFERAGDVQDEKYAPKEETEEKIAKSWKSANLSIVRVNRQRDLVIRMANGKDIPIENQAVSKITLSKCKELIEKYKNRCLL